MRNARIHITAHFGPIRSSWHVLESRFPGPVPVTVGQGEIDITEPHQTKAPQKQHSSSMCRLNTVG
eukprot:3532675-Rhodomonas_salina.3